MKKRFLAGFWQLFKGYWSSEEKWQARGLLGVVILLSLGGVVISVLINQWYNVFYNALQEYKYEDFWPLIGKFTLLAFIHIALAVYAMYLRQMLQLKWRTWMTRRYVERWMKAQAYYRMQIIGDDTDNPDQRISEDINLFVTLTLQLALGFLKQAAMLGAFIVILWNLSGVVTVPLGGEEFTVYGYMVWLSLLYAVAGTYLTHRVGRQLIHLNYDQQRFEADFRFNMMRVRENSESIAFYRGEAAEQQGFRERFSHVIRNYWALMRREKALTWFTSGYSQLAIIMPILMAAPRYFSGAIQLGGLMQTSSAFGNVQDSLSFFVNSYSSLAQWTAVVKRLIGFNEHMALAAGIESNVEVVRAGSAVAIRDLQVALPDGQLLLQNFSLHLSAGDRVLITGASGVGKSTLMRALAGIWPFSDGRINLPEGNGRCLFLSQRPYLPLGSLRQAICYPFPAEQVEAAGIERVLQLCQLDKFIGQLDRVDDWSRILSLGEQQRIAFSRILLVKPSWVFLDESSSAMDEPMEKYMYNLLRQHLPETAVVSVGHRSTLLEHHEKQLKLLGAGCWEVVPII